MKSIFKIYSYIIRNKQTNFDYYYDDDDDDDDDTKYKIFT